MFLIQKEFVVIIMYNVSNLIQYIIKIVGYDHTVILYNV